MADSDQSPIVQLGPDDALAGLALTAEAQWNQNEADWRFLLAHGTVFGVRGSAGRPVATAALLPYTSENAWICMVLVTESRRGRGLATRLVDACLDAASKQGLTTWLDATAAGTAVYGPLGFTPTIQLRRLRLEHAPASKPTAPLRAGQPTEFITCDISAMGFDRRDLLNELGGRPGSRLLSNGDAMALVRDGRTARQIGPLFAEAPRHALAMVRDIVASETGPLLIDAVANHDEFLTGLTEAGWTVEQSFQRMRFGRATTPPDELPFAVAGPEYG